MAKIRKRPQIQGVKKKIWNLCLGNQNHFLSIGEGTSIRFLHRGIN